MNSIDFPPESTVIGRLSLSSFVKVCMIAALGALLVFVLLALVALSIGLLRAGLSRNDAVEKCELALTTSRRRFHHQPSPTIWFGVPTA